MNLFQLTIRNVQRNFRLYTIYFLSMIIGVMIHFTFSSLMYNKDILAAIENKSNFQTGVTISSVAVFLFIIFFILYCNSFFMKQRKKEFGMYVLFGMSEWQITFMIFYETLMLGAVSLVAGILLGGLLSKLFGMILMNLMQYDNVISLSFPIEAIGTTILLFFLLAIIISVQSYFNIRRVQLIELFHAKEKMDKPFQSSPLLAFLSIFLIGLAIVLITRGKESSVWQDYTTISMLAATVGIILGTYLFFRQFTGWFLEALRKKKHYHEGNSVLWTSSLRFQVRGNTLNLTFIALFSAVIMMLISFVFINYKVQFESVGRNIPNHIAFQSLDETTNKEIEQAIKESKHEIEYHETIETIRATPKTDINAAFDTHKIAGLLLVSNTDYNEIISLRGDDEKVNLTGTEAVSLAQGADFPKTYAENQRPHFTVNTKEETTFQIAEMKDYALLGWATDPNTSMIEKPAVLVISDEAYKELAAAGDSRSFEIYHITDAKNAEELSEKVHGMVSKTEGAYYSSFADVYSRQIENSALMFFAAMFLAVIALFALASVIYFKQLREATEEQEQYQILRKLGVGNKEIKSVIRKQMLFVFFPPLILALLHGWLVIKYYILDSIQGNDGLTGATLIIFAAFLMIYVLFYASATNIYYKIVQQKY
ncbi:ABC transporter permease [Bacillus sp. J33]|uniref:ABC transporter permease n=1 Tax=Bacillus sp. J33 TaxID=935836 RepID=UPI00047E43BF|nr:ABC transporter permease [Bacillus sp. J33]